MNNILYTVTSSKTCAEVVEWLNENNIPFNERRISKANPLRQSELLLMLKISENGFEEIVKRNKKFIKMDNKDVALEDLSTSKLIDTIISQPSILRTPILLNSNKMVVGFQITEMGMFIPRNIRKKELKKLLCKN